MNDIELEKLAEQIIEDSGMWVREFDWEIALKDGIARALRTIRDQTIKESFPVLSAKLSALQKSVVTLPKDELLKAIEIAATRCVCAKPYLATQKIDPGCIACNIAQDIHDFRSQLKTVQIVPSVPISDAQKEELKRLYLENSKLSEKISCIEEANQIYQYALQDLMGDKWAASQLCKYLEHDGGSYHVGEYCKKALKEAESRILGGMK